MEIKDELKDLHEWRLSELQSIEDAFNDKFANIMQKLKSKAEKKPVVPWIGAIVYDMYGKYGYSIFEAKTQHVGMDGLKMVDDPLHPQFMPNDGVNPWPDGIRLQLLRSDHHIWPEVSNSNNLRWSIRGESADIIGSRPACGWAEYLKEREK